MSSHTPLHYALIHSPLTGPEVWQPLAAQLRADQLRAGGMSVTVPDLVDDAGTGLPLWQQHVTAAATAIAGAPASDKGRTAAPPLILVAHSGAGPLLGPLGAALSHPPSAYLFVDAGLPPRQPLSRLAAIRAEGGVWAEEFEAFLAAGGRFPSWTTADLADTLPKVEQRRSLIDALRSRGRAYFDEVLPGTPDVAALPGAYLQLTPAYAVYAEQASRWGWPVRYSDGGHFAMMASPATISGDLQALAEQVLAIGRRSGPS